MIPFFLLLFIPALFCFAGIKKKASNVRVVSLGVNETTKKNSMALPVFFFLFLVMLMLRHETVGRDLLAYKDTFKAWASVRFQDYLVFEPEILFYSLTWWVGQWTDSYQVYLAVTACLTVIPVAVVYIEERRHSLLKIILFVSMSTFVMFFSGIRQSVAMAIGMIAYLFVRRKKLLGFLVMVFLAVGFHHSGFMVLFMYPLYHAQFKKKHLWFLLPVIAGIALYNQQIFSIIGSILGNYADEYAMEIQSTGAYGMLFLFFALAVFSYVIPDERRMDEEAHGLRNFLLFSIVLQLFAPLHTLAMRMNYYYMLFIPLLLPKVVEYRSRRWNQVGIIGKYCIMLFFMLYFFMYMRGSPLDVYPYHFFWENV